MAKQKPKRKRVATRVVSTARKREPVSKPKAKHVAIESAKSKLAETRKAAKLSQARVREAKANLSATRKQVKAAQAKVRETKKVVKRNAKASPKVQDAAKQLRDINKLLGEEYDTLKQALRALKRESEPVSKVLATVKVPEKVQEPYKPTKPKGKKERLPEVKLPTLFTGKREPIMTVMELRKDQRKGFYNFVSDIRGGKDIDKQIQLSKGEYLAMQVPYYYKDKNGNQQIGYSRSINLFTSVAQLLKKISEYKQRNDKLGVKSSSTAKWGDTIKIVKVKTSPSEWTAGKKRETRERKAMFREIYAVRDKEKK